MKKSVIKSLIVTSCMGLALSVVSPSVLSVKAAREEEKMLQLDKSEKRKLDKAIDSFKKENEGLGLSDLELAQKFVRENSQPKNSVQSRGVVGIGLKGLRYIGYIFRIGGKGISILVRPLSKSKAALVRKYSAKIAKACEKVEKATKSAFRAKLKELGVPSDVAKNLTDIVFMLL
ncbi:hypothetical protein ACYRFS_05625 [Listeria kieliensis]